MSQAACVKPPKGLKNGPVTAAAPDADLVADASSCANQQLFELLRLLPYEQPEEAVDACLLLSCCGGHALGAQLAQDLHTAVGATSSSIVQQTRWFLGCAVLVANAGTMTQLDRISRHNAQLIATTSEIANFESVFKEPPPAFRIVQRRRLKVRLQQVRNDQAE